MVDDLAARFGGSVVRTPVGQAFIAEKMKELRSTLGGEGSGGVSLPCIHFTNDSLAVIALILEHMAAHGGTLTELDSELPRYFLKEKDIALAPYEIFSALQTLRTELDRTEENVDLTDGIRWEWPDSWLHIRASNTE